MQGMQQSKLLASLKSESVWFKTKLVSQFLTLSFLLTQPFYLSYLHAAPVGGEVVGGTGSISQIDLTTTINQTSQNLAVDWQSFDVSTNERVQFIQPNTSSIALNRILGNNGTTIQGQIDANGQVILVNPNGIFFTSTSTINVGGLIASSLDMSPSDFMNGNYIFNEVLGIDGAVVNSGLITASLGGNVALIGKQVKNDGLISANLGSVVLAGGKQSVLTFDDQGLIGVKVSKEILQEELGVEEAVINSGEINVAGGRVLLTASTSKDVFSQVVNSGALDKATSVVVNEDGTFTLGGGADVLNTGSIDVSSKTNDKNTARIVLLGENITSSGNLKADVENGKAGEIEIHANNKTLLTKNSITSAKALSSGQGGLIKILGDKVGLFDNAQVNVSGANGGGTVLIGGDQEGNNTKVRNANFIYLGENTSVKANASDNGNGGTVIAFAMDSARIHGQLFARGGLNGGDGGFIETSGLRGFEITSVPNASAYVGVNGTWLIDPYNILISSSSTRRVNDDDPTFSYFDAIASGARVDVADIITGLKNGDVIIRTTRTDGDLDEGTETGNITFEAHLDYNGVGSSSTLTLEADNDINTNERNIIDGDVDDGDDLLNIVFNADSDSNGTGNIIISNSRIYTNGGLFTATGIDFTLTGSGLDFIKTTDESDSTSYGDVNLFMSGDVLIGADTGIISNGGAVNIGYIDTADATNNIIPTSFTSSGYTNTSGGDDHAGGNISVTTSGVISITDTAQLIADGGSASDNTTGQKGGDISLTAGDAITISSTTNNISSIGSDGNKSRRGSEKLGGDGGSVTITTSSGDINISSSIVTQGGSADGTSGNLATGGTGGKVDVSATNGTVSVAGIDTSGGKGDTDGYDGNGGDAGQIILSSNSTVTLNDNLNALGGVAGSNSGIIGSGNSITINGNTIINKSLSIGLIVNISITATLIPSLAKISLASKASFNMIPVATIVASLPSFKTIPLPISKVEVSSYNCVIVLRVILMYCKP